MIDDITKELAEILRKMRNFADMGEIPAAAYMVRADAVLDRYVDALRTPEKPPMTINLKDYEGKLVVVTLRNEWMIVSLVYSNEGAMREYYPYSIDGEIYTYNGRIFSDTESPYDIVDIALAEEDPEPVITGVEVITDEGRVYTNWEKDNKITTSLQDNGKTLKVFVNTTKEPEMPITKPNSYEVMPSEKKVYII